MPAYKTRELSNADIRLILRGKALEFYSKHYGQVFSISGDGEREILSIQTALAGINQLLDEGGDDAAILPPSSIRPEAYIYLRLFGTKIVDDGREPEKESVEHDNPTARLGITWLDSSGWQECQSRSHRGSFRAMSQRPRKEMKTELDQAHFLIGGTLTGDINLEEELTKDTWMVSPYVAAVLDWYGKFSPDDKDQRSCQARGRNPCGAQKRSSARSQNSSTDRCVCSTWRIWNGNRQTFRCRLIGFPGARS